MVLWCEPKLVPQRFGPLTLGLVERALHNPFAIFPAAFDFGKSIPSRRCIHVNPAPMSRIG